MYRLNRTIIKTAIFLSFITVSCAASDSESIDFDKNKAGGLYEMSQTGEQFQDYNSTEIYYLNDQSHISFKNFESISRQEDNDYGSEGLLLELNPIGASLFSEMTNRNLGRQLCFVINDKVVAAPFVNSVIDEGSIVMDMGADGSLEDIIKLLEQ